MRGVIGKPVRLSTGIVRRKRRASVEGGKGSRTPRSRAQIRGGGNGGGDGDGDDGEDWRRVTPLASFVASEEQSRSGPSGSSDTRFEREIS